jgi:hypothetical protein
MKQQLLAVGMYFLEMIGKNIKGRQNPETFYQRKNGFMKFYFKSYRGE